MINKNRKEEIERISLNVLESAYKGFPKKPIVELIKILKSLKINLIEAEFESNEVDGAYNRKENNIYISSEISIFKKTFIIANGIGHHVLHEDFIQIQIFSKYRNFQNIIDVLEYESHYFALCLLMPEYLMEQYFFNLTKDISGLSSIFGVSEFSFIERLHFIINKEKYKYKFFI